MLSPLTQRCCQIITHRSTPCQTCCWQGSSQGCFLEVSDCSSRFHNSLKSFLRRNSQGCNWEQMRRPMHASMVMSTPGWKAWWAGGGKRNWGGCMWWARVSERQLTPSRSTGGQNESNTTAKSSQIRTQFKSSHCFHEPLSNQRDLWGHFKFLALVWLLLLCSGCCDSVI